MKTKKPTAAKAIERITPPPPFNLDATAEQLRDIATAISSGGLTPQCRRMIGAVLAPPHLLAKAYTVAVHKGEPIERQAFLRTALELLGRLLSGRVINSGRAVLLRNGDPLPLPAADAARQLQWIADGLAGEQAPATPAASITIAEFHRMTGIPKAKLSKAAKAGKIQCSRNAAGKVETLDHNSAVAFAARDAERQAAREAEPENIGDIRRKMRAAGLDDDDEK